MRLAQITRYPVRSLQGDVVPSAEVEPDGLRGDRCRGSRDETTGKVLTARRAPQLLFATAALAPDGEPVITPPTGVTRHGPGATTDAALSRWLGKPVRLVSSVGAPACRAGFSAERAPVPSGPPGGRRERRVDRGLLVRWSNSPHRRGAVAAAAAVHTLHDGPPRCRSLLAVIAVLAATSSACVAVASGSPQITVMTRNLYLGTGLNDSLGASSWPQLVAAGSHDWANVLTTDFPTRAGALAEEIRQARPDVVGLQEVTLWRDQTPSDVGTHPVPDATHVAFDFLAILLGALRARGSPYTSVATSTNADIEVPRRGPGGDLVDLRVTDRDALLVRTDEADRSSNPRSGHYTAQVSEALVPGPVDSPRGWVTIDYRADPRTTVRIFSTHLEVADPAGRRIQEMQGEEALALIAASPHPVIALGDFNSPADGSGADTYRNLTAVLQDAWAAARPADPGWTCCQGELLDDPVGRERSRIDLVLTPENWHVLGVARTGDRPFRAAPPPLWASDHAGVTARILIPGR